MILDKVVRGFWAVWGELTVGGFGWFGKYDDHSLEIIRQN